MRQLFFAALGALVIGLFGCDDGSDESAPIRLDAMVRVVDGEDSVQGDAGPMMTADTGRPADGGMMTPDEGMGNPILPPVDTCEQICALYERCDRLDIWPGRSIGACQEACEAASTIENFSRYQLCLQTTTCERLQDCRLPQRPRATCAQVCDAVSECGADARIPGQLDAFETVPAWGRPRLQRIFVNAVKGMWRSQKPAMKANLLCAFCGNDIQNAPRFVRGGWSARPKTTW